MFPGIAFGASVASGGDLVVNTSQTGYQEVCTDPSYAGQIVVMTYPLIGNYGRLRDDDQSEHPWLRALIVANATAAVLDDARQLATLLRGDGQPGDRRGRHARARAPPADDRLPPRHRHGSRRDGRRGRDRAARAVPRWEDQDFVAQVSPAAVREVGDPTERGPLVAIVDFGLKANIVHSLRRRGARVRVLPHTATPEAVLADDVTASSCRPARRSVAARRPGRAGARHHRRRAAAAGHLPRPPDRRPRRRRGDEAAAVRASRGEPSRAGPRHRLRAGHRAEPRGPGHRQFVRQRLAVPVSQINLNDRSVEGLRHRTKPIETVQYHPEGAPGPLDALAVFDRFIARLDGR